MRSSALAYARRGWAVLPLYEVRDGRCACGDPSCKRSGKHPRIRGGALNASRDPARIEAWWTAWPEANVGIATGAASGLVVLDVDEEAGGEAGLRELCGPDLPPAPRVRTGRGFHLYFRCPEDVRIRNRVALAPGVDVRGEGGYVVAPPSRHVSGATYAWERAPEEVSLPPLPPAVLARLVGPRPAPVVEERIPQGERNNTLTSLAGTMRRRGMSEEEIFAALQAVNARRCDPPLEEEEVRRIAVSVSRYPPHDGRRGNDESETREPPAPFENRADGLYFQKSKVANFQLYPHRVLLLEDGQQIVRAELRTGRETCYLDLPPDAFTDVRNFRAHILPAEAVWLSGKRGVLWKLQEWLSAEGVPRIHAATAMGRWQNGREAFWVLPGRVLGPEGPVEDPGVVFLDRHRVASMLPIHYPTLRFEPAFAREVVDLLLNLNAPLVALGVLGWHMACPYAEALGRQGYRFPILYLWGTRGSGKTTTIEIYQRLSGYTRPVGLNILTTPFARMVRLTVSNGVPIHLAELRWLSSSKLEQAVRDLILQYDGIRETRGRSDLSVLEFRRTAPIVVDGEEPAAEPALQERVVGLNLTVAVTQQPDSPYARAAQRLRELPLQRFAGPYVLWTLRAPPPLEGARDIVSRVPETRALAERVRRNLTVVVVGLLSLKHFLLEGGLEALPTEHVESWVRLYVREVEPMQRSHARIFLEHMVSLYVEGRLPYARLERREDETILWFPIHLAYYEWRARSRTWGLPTLMLDALERQLEEEAARGLVRLERRDAGGWRNLPMCGLCLRAAAAAGLRVPS